MRDSDFEGSSVLEQLAARGWVERFMEAIDSDDFETAKSLMKKAGIGAQEIREVLKRMSEQGPA